jgi:hypothetical protein
MCGAARERSGAMHHREAGLIADGVVAPDFRHVHLVLGRKATRDVDGSGRNIQMKRGARATKMRPLRHRFEVIDGLGGFHLDGSHQFVSAFCRGEDEIRKNLDLADPYGHRLLFANVHNDVMTTFQANLQESNHTVVLQLLANRANEYRAHVTSTKEKTWKVREKEPRIITCSIAHCIVKPTQNTARP